ncbi:MAG: hypothetical protein E4H00_05120 [Myxococcales bacterium]|nr:MAG: hypothetical protein E4H00_05120 [Myxococcales bacterium]
MAKYVFVYHGGKKSSTPEAGQQVMAEWGAWFEKLGPAVIDGGNPLGPSKTVRPGGEVQNDGGSNPASGYSLIEASSIEDATEKAKGCPILKRGGNIEVAEAMEM